MNYSNINYCWAELIIEELIRCGAGVFCIAPGSRNTPLALTAASKAVAVSHFDERGLGFYALGTTAATNKPPVLICTSGSAVANFLPAVAECSKKKLPMIVLTADRPYEAKDAGAPQTMKQEGIFGDFVSWETSLPSPTEEVKPEVVLTTVDYAVFRSKRPVGSPVHINCMFREPLDPAAKTGDLTAYMKGAERWLSRSNVYTEYSAPCIEAVIPEDLPEAAMKARRGVIGVGKLKGPEEQRAVEKLAEKLNWPVFADVTSGLKLSGKSENIIESYDHILLNREFMEEYPADFVIQIGGRITAKRWLQYVEHSRPDHYVMVLGHPLRNDPLHSVTHRIESPAGSFTKKFADMVDRSEKRPEFTRVLIELDKRVRKCMVSSGISGELNDIGVAVAVSELATNGDTLYLSSSMPVRDMDMYGVNRGRDITVVSNRGLNGIDGVVASAAGFSSVRDGRTTLVIGDLAMLHDLNSLALIKDKPVTIVVNNNGGGGIFSFLPANTTGGADYDRFCAAPHSMEFSGAAEMFGIEYSKAGTYEEFCKIYRESLSSDKPILIEVLSSRDDNLRIHRNMAEACRSVVSDFLNSMKGGNCDY